MLHQQRCILLLSEKLSRIVLSILTAGGATTYLTCLTSNISASTHSELFADKKNHINGIESFWNQANRHMRKFNGVPKAHFGLFLKECDWHFNNSNPPAQLSQLRQWVKGNLNSLSGIAPKLRSNIPTRIEPRTLTKYLP